MVKVFRVAPRQSHSAVKSRALITPLQPRKRGCFLQERKEFGYRCSQSLKAQALRWLSISFCSAYQDVGKRRSEDSPCAELLFHFKSFSSRKTGSEPNHHAAFPRQRRRCTCRVVHVLLPAQKPSLKLSHPARSACTPLLHEPPSHPTITPSPSIALSPLLNAISKSGVYSRPSHPNPLSPAKHSRQR